MFGACLLTLRLITPVYMKVLKYSFFYMLEIEHIKYCLKVKVLLLGLKRVPGSSFIGLIWGGSEGCLSFQSPALSSSLKTKQRSSHWKSHVRELSSDKMGKWHWMQFINHWHLIMSRIISFTYSLNAHVFCFLFCFFHNVHITSNALYCRLFICISPHRMFLAPGMSDSLSVLWN